MGLFTYIFCLLVFLLSVTASDVVCRHHVPEGAAPSSTSGSLAIALIASCPDHCHRDLSMVQSALQSTFQRLALDNTTTIYAAYTPTNSTPCHEYFTMLQAYLRNYNHCLFLSRGLSHAFLVLGHIIHQEFMLVLEHDWEILPVPQHSAQALVAAFQADPNLNQILFRKLPAQHPIQWADSGNHDISVGGVPLTVSPVQYFSNNPSIVRSLFFKHRMPLFIDRNATGKFGVEDGFQYTVWGKDQPSGGRFPSWRSAFITTGLTMYGNTTSQPTIRHTDTHQTDCRPAYFFTPDA